MENTENNGIVKIVRTAKAGVPPAFSERCVVRIRSHKFGPNSNQNPMITIEPELVGWFNPDGKLVNTIERGGQTYILGGVDCKSEYFTLKDKGLEVYADFWNRAHPGEELTEINVNNPDREYLTGLLMQVLVSGRSEPYLRQITEEEKAELKAQGKRPVGEPIRDEDGKPIEKSILRCSNWLRRYTGELPEGTPPME
jgi:hypothetical protein